MALSFPGSPVLNQIYEAEGTRFQWNGSLWLIVGSGAAIGDMDASVYDPTNIIDDAFDRGNHTGTQLAATISDFSSAVAATAAVTANTAKVTNATHTGEVTGATALTITNGAVTLAKQADVATATVFYRTTAGAGAPEVQPLATLKTDLGLTGTNSGDQTITLTGEVTGTGTGSFAATISADSVTNVKLANMATQTIKGRTTAGTGDPEDLTPAQTRTILNVADGATANASDAALRDRSTHTGTQLSSTISDISLTITNGVLALIPSVVAVEDFVGENTQGLLADLLVTAADSARFAGAWRSRDLGAINWYFAAQAMVLAPEAFTQAERQTFCAVAIDRGVVSPRQNTTAYTSSTFVTFPSGKVFFCNIAGTTAGSAPSDAAIVTAGSFLGDGGVTWEYTGLQVPATWQWFLVDIASNLLTVVAPDSTDAYPAMLAAAAELANVDAAWLNTASAHTGNTRMQVINNLIQNSMTDELTGTSPGARLSYTFQHQLTPAGAAYTIRFLADNVEVWRGYIAQAALLTTVGSSPTTALQNAADVKTGILSTQLFDSGRFKAYVGRPNWDTITGDAVFETDFRFHLFPYLYGMLDGVTEQQTYGDDVAVYIRDEVPGLFNASLGTFPMVEGFYALGKMGLQKAFDTALWRVTSRNVANVVISDAAIVSTILDLGPPQNIANNFDAFLLARANHTGTQLASTVSDFTDAVRLAPGYATTATAGGTTTLTAASADVQVFTGTLSQTLVLPVVSTLALGRTFKVINRSSGNITVQSSGLNTIATVLADNVSSDFICVLTTGTGASSWVDRISGVQSRSGVGSMVFTGGPTINNITLTGTITGIDSTDISNFDAAVAANSAVVLNTAKVTNATHTGDVTGDTVLTIANNAVNSAKILDDAVNSAKILDGAVNYNKIANGAVSDVKLADNGISNAKLVDVATATIKGRITAGTGDLEDLSASQVRTLINVADGATANSSDATLLARANHTGTQTASTISDFSEAVDDRVATLAVAGLNMAIVYDDVLNTLTFSSSGGGGGGASPIIGWMI